MSFLWRQSLEGVTGPGAACCSGASPGFLGLPGLPTTSSTPIPLLPRVYFCFLLFSNLSIKSSFRGKGGACCGSQRSLFRTEPAQQE